MRHAMAGSVADAPHRADVRWYLGPDPSPTRATRRHVRLGPAASRPAGSAVLARTHAGTDLRRPPGSARHQDAEAEEAPRRLHDRLAPRWTLRAGVCTISVRAGPCVGVSDVLHYLPGVPVTRGRNRRSGP